MVVVVVGSSKVSGVSGRLSREFRVVNLRPSGSAVYKYGNSFESSPMEIDSVGYFISKF